MTTTRREASANKTRAASVPASTSGDQSEGRGSTPTAVLQISPKELNVMIIAPQVARVVFERYHYLHSMPGGTVLCFGAFMRDKLYGALSLGVGPKNAHRLVEGVNRTDCLTLTRLWLDDILPRNSESRVIGQVIRALKQHTKMKFLISYADPAEGHMGIIYQATNWLYTGISDPQPKLDLGDGVPRHLRSVGSAFGTHSGKYFREHGLDVKFIPQSGKHRYLFFVDPSWRNRLRVPVLPYPKKGDRESGNP